MRSDLNEVRSVQSRMCLGREFQRVGAATEKAWSPQVRHLDLGIERRFASDERRQREVEARRKMRLVGAGPRPAARERGCTDI